MKFGTKAIHAGIEPDMTTGAIMTPIYQTSTFVQPLPGHPVTDKHGQIYEYARSHNPTRIVLERNLAALTSSHIAPEKLGGLCFASGLAATDAVLKLMRPGDHVIKGDDLYGGSHRLLDGVFGRMGIAFTDVDMANLTALENAIQENTKLVWLETPTNPMLKIADIEAVGRLVKSKNPDILFVVDNTFCSPYIQQPLDLGADIVVHSATKYIGGHSDLVMGAVVCKKGIKVPYTDPKSAFGAKDTTTFEQLKWLQNAVGAVPAPFDCFLALRGIKTLHLRMEQHSKNATAVAQLFVNHPKIDEVFYPGLPTHKDHAVAAKQMRLFGGMVSFRLKEDTKAEVDKFMSALHKAPNKTVSIAESLGGVESLANHPVTMTHGAVPKAKRDILGISEGLVRLSIGIEATEDILEDVRFALASL